MLIDAFVVRMVFVPAVLAVLGRAAWWLPPWLARALPSFDVEGEGLRHRLQMAAGPRRARPARSTPRGSASPGPRGRCSPASA
nr:hypothetical protein GCM10020093_051260 [Planobispora longispora]